MCPRVVFSLIPFDVLSVSLQGWRFVRWTNERSCCGKCKGRRFKNLKFTFVQVLVTKENGTFHAVGAKCPHYGAPLANGYYDNGRPKIAYKLTV